MKRSTDIESYNKIVQMDRVYTLSDGLDDMLNKIRSDVSALILFPLSRRPLLIFVERLYNTL